MPEPVADGGGVKAAAEALKSFGDLIKPFTDPVFSQLGEYVADKIRFLRIKNSVRVLVRAREILRDNGLDPVPVEAKILVAVLEGAGLEEENELVERWSRLLASAGAGAKIPPSFPVVLGQLLPDDGRVLDLLLEHLLREVKGGWPPGPLYLGITGREVRKNLGLGNPAFMFSVVNLIRLGLVAKTSTLIGGTLEMAYDHDGYALTFFGGEFVKACRGPTSLGRNPEVVGGS